MAVRPSGVSRTTPCDSAPNAEAYDGIPSDRPSPTSDCALRAMRAWASWPAMATTGRLTDSRSQRSRVRVGRSSSDTSVSAGRIQYVSSARERASLDSSRHSLSTFSHSRPSIAAFQSRHCSSPFGESGCAAMPNPPRRCTSSSTSRASPARRYGDCGIPKAIKWPSSVLISTASMSSTPST